MLDRSMPGSRSPRLGKDMESCGGLDPIVVLSPPSAWEPRFRVGKGPKTPPPLPLPLMVLAPAEDCRIWMASSRILKPEPVRGGR